MKYHNCLVNLNNVVIPECLCREFSDFTVPKISGLPTQVFSDDSLNHNLDFF